MHLLLCAATEFEIKPTIDFLDAQSLNQRVTVLVTGLGLTATAYHLTKAVATKDFDCMIQAGLAGSLSEDFPLSEVVVVEKDCLADQGVVENNSFQSGFDLNLIQNNQPWTDGWLQNPHTALVKQTGLVSVNSASVNEITTNARRIEHYRETGAQIESMEGAALHYVALMENLPFLQLRSISNFVGERDKSKWALQQAIERLNSELQRIILKIVQQ